MQISPTDSDCRLGRRKGRTLSWLLQSRTTPIIPTPTLRERYNLLN